MKTKALVELTAEERHNILILTTLGVKSLGDIKEIANAALAANAIRQKLDAAFADDPPPPPD